MSEKEIRDWYTNEWLAQDSLNREYNFIARNKCRIVLLRNEINDSIEEDLYCKRLENRIKKLLEELKSLSKMKEEDIKEEIPGLDKTLMRISGESSEYIEKDLKLFRGIEKRLAYAGIMENFSRKKHLKLVEDLV